MIELKPKFLLMDKASISSYLRDSFRENSLNYDNVLKSALSIKITNTQLSMIQEQFYIQVANYKLNNLESYFTNNELTALAETRLKLTEHSSEKFKEIKEIQANIEFYGKLIEEYQRDFVDIAREINELENNIENTCEKKAVYIKHLEDLQDKYFLEQRDANQVENLGNSSFISKNDLLQVQEKIKIIDDQLKELTKEYINKVNVI